LLRRAAELVKRVINYQILGILLYDEATQRVRHRLDVKYGQSALGKCESRRMKALLARRFPPASLFAFLT